MLKRLLMGVLVLSLAACNARSAAPTAAGSSSPAATQADFGTLQNVCHPGTPGSSTAQGVTATQIQLGVMSDVGFTKNQEFGNAAKVFTAWCNAAGGVNGRKLVGTVRDTALTQVDQQVLVACKSDFALVGGGSALDGLGEADRLKCLLPSYPAQTTQSNGDDLQVIGYGAGVGYNIYAPYYSWLIKEKYPDSAAKVGIIAGDVPFTKVDSAQDAETIKALGGTVAYSDLYPAQGVTDWTPYAESIKTKNVKGLIFLGDFASLAKLEQALDNIGYKPDWIDANSNAYGPAFVALAGSALSTQVNYADLTGEYPLEQAANNPATKQLVDLFAKYAPGAQVTYPAVRAFAAWLLFATSASACTDLTASCVYDNAIKQSAWTGGGLQAPTDLTSVSAVIKCFNVVQATAKGWTVPDFGADTGAYRCNGTPYKYTGTYPAPLTLATVGKSMSEFK